MTRYFLFIGTVVLLSSCQSIIVAREGVKKPKTEDGETQKRFLEQRGINDSLNNILSFQSLMPVVSSGIAPTSVYVFDRNGNHLKLPGGTNKCAPEPLYFIQNLALGTPYPREDDFVLDSVLSWVRTPDNREVSLRDDTTDFYVFITWSVWTGKKVFERDITPSIAAIDKNKNVRIRLALLNLDMQRSWGEENLKKVKFTRMAMQVNF